MCISVLHSLDLSKDICEHILARSRINVVNVISAVYNSGVFQEVSMTKTYRVDEAL
uniref:Zinc finger protein 664-like protein isoform x2 n=1 Tax=Triatoma infestans TaxID=30076 RepID=A0A170TWZ2_TRIIF